MFQDYATVQHVIGEVSRSKAWAARPADLLPKTRRSRQEKDSRPLFFDALFRQRSQKLFQHAVELLRFSDEEGVRGLVDNLYRHLRPTLAHLFRCGDGPFERRIDEEHGSV